MKQIKQNASNHNEGKYLLLLLLTILAIIVLNGCKKNTISPQPFPNKVKITSGTLNITTKQHCSGYIDDILENCTVNIYLSKSNFDNNAVDRSSKSNEQGIIIEKDLKAQLIYYKAYGNINIGNCVKNNVTNTGTINIINGTNNYIITLK